MQLSEPKKLRGLNLFRHLFDQQKEWIDYCHNNGKSYVGPNGLNIMKSDYDELHRLEQLIKFRKRG